LLRRPALLIESPEIANKTKVTIVRTSEKTLAQKTKVSSERFLTLTVPQYGSVENIKILMISLVKVVDIVYNGIVGTDHPRVFNN
ncbi:MAG: hypothetical protein ACK6D3_03330, partial [Planctomycetaceae bacterium]|jgi:hypothetical protein